MNIFILSTLPSEAARYLHDKHVVKMGLEATQIACTALYLAEPRTYDLHKEWLYKPTHTSHPWVIWAAQTLSHLKTITIWGGSIFYEYAYRYNRIHKSSYTLDRVANILRNYEIAPIDESAPRCFPEKYNIGDIVSSYRNYYQHEKMSNAKYTNREWPEIFF